jgi:hypothetical protein
MPGTAGVSPSRDCIFTRVGEQLQGLRIQFHNATASAGYDWLDRPPSPPFDDE